MLFARAPGGVWVSEDELPSATVDALKTRIKQEPDDLPSLKDYRSYWARQSLDATPAAGRTAVTPRRRVRPRRRDFPDRAGGGDGMSPTPR